MVSSCHFTIVALITIAITDTTDMFATSKRAPDAQTAPHSRSTAEVGDFQREPATTNVD